MKNKVNFLLSFLLLSILIIIFSRWFITPEIIGGDWPYFYPEMLKEFSLPPYLWSLQGGGVNANFPSLSYISASIVLSNILHIPWTIVYKFFWFGLFIFLSVFSSLFLFKKIFPEVSSLFTFISIIVYVSNTYILMIVGGGQMGVALAYSITPLIIALYIQIVSINYKKKISIIPNKEIVLLSLVTALQVLFDIRICYLTILVIGLYTVFHYIFIQRFTLFNILITFVSLFFLVLLLHSSWLFPFIIFHLFSIPGGVTSSSGFTFFSFSDFSHTLSFLHPNWPENIFGKVYFLQPEFLILPILAYSSLLFILKNQNDKTMKHSNNVTIIFFALLGLLGIFLAKGTNEPFGVINNWIFQTIPGMNLFRDPTKFYIIIALSYSILVPYSLFKIYERVACIKYRVFNNYISQSIIYAAIIAAFLFFWLFTIRQAVLGQLSGTFHPHLVPKEYVQLKNFIVDQSDFFRTFWVPTQTRFRLQTENHPLILAQDFFNAGDAKKLIKKLKEKNSQELLQKYSVKYVIIPYDSTAEVFLEDRKYSQKKRDQVESELDTVPWLKKIQNNKITIYENKNFISRFSFVRKNNIEYKQINPTEYSLSTNLTADSLLTFSEYYHPQWKASANGLIIKPIKTREGLIQYPIPKGKQQINVYFLPQHYVLLGYALSTLTLILTIFFLLSSYAKK